MPDEFDYKGEVDRLLLAMQFLAQVDLAGILDVIAKAHAIGPFIDPTAYRDALYSGDMDAIGALARALEPAQRVWREDILPKVPKPDPVVSL